MKKVAFMTLGCKVNQYESAGIRELFIEQGYSEVGFKEVADVYIINTCTVTNSGDSKSRNMIRKAIRTNPEAIVCVTGCYAQTSPKEIQDIEGVDLIIGTDDKDKIMDYINSYDKEKEPINQVSKIMKVTEFNELKAVSMGDKTRASLKIQEGCNNFCTYCIIPWARGLMRSKKPELVIEQCQELVNQGYLEIVLTGIHTGGYGQDLENYNFANLLEDIATKVEGKFRIRISSIEATQIDSDVLAILEKYEHVFAKHFHIPLQSGSEIILKKMRRKYTKAQFKAGIDRLRAIWPDVSITTDVIVGFPQEGEEEFQECVDFIKEINFSELHIFPYSKRNGTVAAKMDNQVLEQVKKERVAKLMEVNNELAKEYAKTFENTIQEVIVERAVKDKVGFYQGHTSNYINVEFQGTEDILGKLVEVEITFGDYPKCQGRVK